MKRWHILALMGLAATCSLALVPIEALLPTELPTWQVRLALVIQPAIFIAISIVVGEKCAARTGLAAPLADAIVAGRGAARVFRGQLPLALVVGIAAAVLLVAYAVWVGPHVAPRGDLAAFASFDMPLATKVLYGGLGEEIITRWALVSLFALIGMVIARRAQAATSVTAIAITLAAMLFAAAHLPLLFLINPSPPVWVIGAVLAGNALPGIGFGWLFWKRGLEAAMIAHIVAHVVSTFCLAIMAAV